MPTTLSLHALRRTVRRTVRRTLIALMILAVAPLHADWAGSKVAKDGVTMILNPAESTTAAETLALKEVWRAGGEDDEDVLFGVITDIVADAKGNFYLLDSQLTEIQVYAPDGTYVRTIGREGEGPGEFRMAFNLLMLPSGNLGVLQTAPAKLVGLTLDGDPADALSLPESEETGFKMLYAAQNAGKDVAVVYGFMQPGESGFTMTSNLSLLNASGQSERKLHSDSSSMKAANPLIVEKEWDSFRNNRWSAGPDGRVYAAPTFGEYTINVWNPDGSLSHVIQREYPDHARTAAHLERVRDLFKGFFRQVPVPNLKFEIEDNWNPIRSIHARDDGTLWVQTSRGGTDLPAGTIGVFDVFDKEGRFDRQVTLKGQGDPDTDGLFFVRDRLFVVTDWLNAMMALQGGGGAEEADEDAAPMEIISYQLQ